MNKDYCSIQSLPNEFHTNFHSATINVVPRKGGPRPGATTPVVGPKKNSLGFSDSSDFLIPILRLCLPAATAVFTLIHQPLALPYLPLFLCACSTSTPHRLTASDPHPLVLASCHPVNYLFIP
jgi:hypothetical protein